MVDWFEKQEGGTDISECAVQKSARPQRKGDLYGLLALIASRTELHNQIINQMCLCSDLIASSRSAFLCLDCLSRNTSAASCRACWDLIGDAGWGLADPGCQSAVDPCDHPFDSSQGSFGLWLLSWTTVSAVLQIWRTRALLIASRSSNCVSWKWLSVSRWSIRSKHSRFTCSRRDTALPCRGSWCLLQCLGFFLSWFFSVY